MTASPAPAPQKTEKGKGTFYIVLAQEDQEPGEGAWNRVGRFSASSANQAIRMYAERAEMELTLVAVPERSWKPVKVTVETTKTVRLG